MYSSFQSTDLDFQLRQREMCYLVLAGLTANTCLEATARQAFELYVTLPQAGRVEPLSNCGLNKFRGYNVKLL